MMIRFFAAPLVLALIPLASLAAQDEEPVDALEAPFARIIRTALVEQQTAARQSSPRRS